MAGDDFFRTRMGARYYDATMPAIAEQLKRIADSLEFLNPRDGAAPGELPELVREQCSICSGARCRAAKARR